jgi:hypothetical protein
MEVVWVRLEVQIVTFGAIDKGGKVFPNVACRGYCISVNSK